ncbi:MAG: hypothetical protein RJB26_925 [Pseudomonadota bacterium]|jgi:predicted amidohydrolase YtcJ
MTTRRHFLTGSLAAATLGASHLAGAGVKRFLTRGGSALLVMGGPIYTGVANHPKVEALLVLEGRVAYAGSLAGARSQVQLLESAAGSAFRTLDLAGAAAFPGFVDSHAHFVGIGLREMTLNLEGTASIAELKTRLAKFAAEQPAGPITGRGWIETHWPEGRFPTRQDLDAVVKDRPVYLERADGHAGVANSVALTLGGVTAGTVDPAGGQVLRDAGGQPTGMLIDRAQSLVADRMPQPDTPMKREALRRANRLYLQRGWTGLHAMSAAAEDVTLATALAGAGELKLRSEHYLDPSGAEEVLARGPYADATGRVRVRGLKLYADGALGSRGAALLAPYADSAKSSGLLQMAKEEAQGWMRRALKVNAQVAMHAIGDRGNRLVLDWFQELLEGDGTPEGKAFGWDRRWRIEHAQVVSPQDIPRFAKLGVIASMQPSHAIGDLYFAGARLGPLRLKGAYAWRSLLDAGATICAGSDAPVEKGDPLIEFYAAVYRHSLDGFAGPSWGLDQVVTRAEALRMLTWAPAYACGREHELGSLQVGKMADLSVFSKDLMTVPPAEILQAKAVFTVVNGEVVFGG